MKKRGQTIKDTVATTKYLLKIIGKNNKSYFILKIFSAVLNAIIPLPLILLPGAIINELVGRRRTEILYIYILILTVVPIAQYLINKIIERFTHKLAFKINLGIETDFFMHVSTMRYETLEDPKIQAQKDRAQNVLASVLGVVDCLEELICSIIGIVAVGTIIVELNWFVIVIVIINLIINSKVSKCAARKQFKIDESSSILERFLFSCSIMINGIYFGKENRIYNTSSILIEKYKDVAKEKNNNEVKGVEIWNIANLFPQLTSGVQNATAYLYLVYDTIFNNCPIGNLTIYISSVNRLAESLSNIVKSYLRLNRQSMYVNDYLDFMNIHLSQYSKSEAHPEFNCNSVIEFSNVSFIYPGSSEYSLKDVSITIRGNEKLCLVGSNGSGKSTFIKLLLRLYEPTKGEILLNNVNIKYYSIDEYYKLFAPVFQDFCLYYLSLRENIVFDNKTNIDKLKEVATQSGINSFIDKLEFGYDTQIGKMIDDRGVDPSGGEGQKLAIARALYHDRQIYLLDEPTASLDPNAEYEIYSKFSSIIHDKCAILITHRLSAVQLADKVAVLEDGKLVEYGTHKELYKKGGIYTEMFDKQAQFYR